MHGELYSHYPICYLDHQILWNFSFSHPPNPYTPSLMTFTPFHVAMCHPTPSKSKSHRPACIHVPRSTTATTSIIATPPRFDLISPNLVSNGNNHNNRDPNTITQARFTCKLNLQGPLHGGDGEEGRGSLQTKPKNPCDYGLLRKEEGHKNRLH